MKRKLKRSIIKRLMKRRKKIIMKKEPMKSFEIIKEMYEHFVKKSRKQEPKLMICEKEDFDNVETALKRLNNIETTAIDLEQENKALWKEAKKLKQALEIIKENLSIKEDDFFYDEEFDKYFFIGSEVSKDKYDLLKEVLRNDR